MVCVMKNATIEESLDLLTPRQLAREVRVTPQTVSNWHRAGIIPARIAVGRIIRFDRSEALAALAAASERKVAQ